MITTFVGRFFSHGRALVLGSVALLGIAQGCGSSVPPGNPEGKGGAIAAKLKDQDLEKFVGTGKAKHKEAISRRDRVKLLHEAANKEE